MAKESKFTARRWALEMTKLWRAASPGERFPVKVEMIALEVSATRFRLDPIRDIKGGNLPGFEGALYPLGPPTGGWAIIFNDSGITPGRRRFTIAHEFGHYLAHRHLMPDGFECDEKAITRRDGTGMEKEADEFAAWLLMPLDDFKTIIKPDDRPTIEELTSAATHYGVSLAAAILRWMDYTDRRAVFVVSRDGGARWARSSNAAMRSGRFIRTKSEIYMLPELSLANIGKFDEKGKAQAIHPAGVWFNEETEETSIYSKRHDLTYTLLHLSKNYRWIGPLEVDEPDTFDRMTSPSIHRR